LNDADREQLPRILREYAPMCLRLAGSHEADRERARDLAQEILVAVWRAWPAFRGQCSEKTYVARIAQYRIASHISRATREPRFTEVPEDLIASELGPEAAALQSDSAQRLLGAIRRLPLAYREVAVLMLEGLSAAEVGAALGVSGNAVAIRSTRARQMLRALLEEPS
jgi:RNA polymerase sigma factor (sigma-70 family)